jgi:hypothetical protein
LTVICIVDFDFEYQSLIVIGCTTFHEDDEAILGSIEWDCNDKVTREAVGVVGTLKDGYLCDIPLPKAPRIQSASHVTSHGAITCDGSTPLNSTPRVDSTPLHSTCICAAPQIQSGGHVTSHGPVTRDNVH